MGSGGVFLPRPNRNCGKHLLHSTRADFSKLLGLRPADAAGTAVLLIGFDVVGREIDNLVAQATSDLASDWTLLGPEVWQEQAYATRVTVRLWWREVV
jgi:hypothetical protein